MTNQTAPEPTAFEREWSQHRADAEAVLDRPYPRKYLDKTFFEGRGWEYTGAFAEVLSERGDKLTKAQWRTLLEALVAGLPVEIDHRTQLGIQRTTYLVEHIGEPTPSGDGMLRVRTWGFGYYLYVNRIVDLRTPKSEYID